MIRSAVLIVVLFVLLSAVSAQCQSGYHAFVWNLDGSSTDLGILAGGDASWAYDINNSGQTVGWSTDAAGNTRAVRWESNGSIVDLGNGVAYGINDLGQAVGTYGDRAVMWDTDGTMYDIAPGNAEKVNSSGQVVGSMTVDVGGRFETHGFIWSLSGGLTDMGKMDGAIGSVARDINDNGWVVGTSLVNPDWSEAFMWNAQSGWTILGDGRAFAISNDGEVVGNTFMGQAFSWTSDTGAVCYSTFGARGINSSDLITGFCYDSEYNTHVAVWHNGSDITDLGVPASCIWSKPYSINDAGQIAGVAMYVPEPATALVLLTGIAGFALRRRPFFG